jgi:hypothetical protein
MSKHSSSRKTKNLIKSGSPYKILIKVENLLLGNLLWVKKLKLEKGFLLFRN